MNTVRRPTACDRYIGHVYAGGDTNIDIGARALLGVRAVEISKTRNRETSRAEITPDAAALLADVLTSIDDRDDFNAFVGLLKTAAEHEGGDRG